ncbi:hypothetical protein FF38_03021 [Lucilia cuprina]|uniref:Uncharacterized protein n=1 Tax=Lucilia cuprina TaxID=7375 RepID=A0A0L0CHC5_LUCCU|nr:hypothetical protein FF38_03021 [Lucilia cuprina]
MVCADHAFCLSYHLYEQQKFPLQSLFYGELLPETADVAAKISSASPDYVGFYDGENTFHDVPAEYIVAEPNVEEARRNEDRDTEENKSDNTSEVLETSVVVRDASKEHALIITKECIVITDETNANDTTTEANLHDVYSTKACANMCINHNNENSGSGNDTEGNDGKIACDKTGNADNELAEVVTTDTGNETFFYGNKDNIPSDEEEEQSEAAEIQPDVKWSAAAQPF